MVKLLERVTATTHRESWKKDALKDALRTTLVDWLTEYVLSVLTLQGFKDGMAGIINKA